MRQERLFDRFVPKYQRIADGRFCYNAAHVRGIILPVSVECPGIDHVVTKRFLLPTVRIPASYLKGTCYNPAGKDSGFVWLHPSGFDPVRY